MFHVTRVSLPEKVRHDVTHLLNKTLASAIDLQLQLKQAHWNVKGMEFIGVHKMLDELHKQIADHVDVVAERVAALGGTALGTLQDVAQRSSLRRYPVDVFSIKEHLELLAHNVALLGEESRGNIHQTEQLGDMVSSDLYIALTNMLDKSLWFIEAHLQK